MDVLEIGCFCCHRPIRAFTFTAELTQQAAKKLTGDQCYKQEIITNYLTFEWSMSLEFKITIIACLED